MAMLSILRKEEPEKELRKLFESRYSDLLSWARQLAGFDKAVAQELVHDAYVALSSSQPDLSEIENLDGYLYRVLRNINQSRIRRAWKHDHDSLDIVDYDSLYLRLHLSRGVDRIDLQDRLIRLCVYLCWRKDSSRAASVLLLRFFRGFYPDEISRLAAMDPRAVRKQIERGRREARAWLADPKKMQVIDGSCPIPSGMSHKQAVTLDAFLARIGALIDLSKNGQCFSSIRIADIYGDPTTAALDTAELGHLVACDQCLTSVCRFLNMNPPDDRLPMDSIGQDREAASRTLDLAEHTVQELRNHEPSALILSLNGEDFYEGQVSGDALRHILTPPNSSEIEFVEIFSHTGLRLLRLDVSSCPPGGPAELWSHVRLGGGRTLSLGVEWYGPDPRVRVEFEELPQELVEIDTVSSRRSEALPEPSVEVPGPQDMDSPWKMLLSRTWSRRLWWLWPVIAVMCGLFVFALVYGALQYLKGSRANPATILMSAAKSETEAFSSNIVSAQSIAFEERSGAGTLLQSGHIEVWRGGHREARKLYDASNKLISGLWKNSRGESVAFANGKLHALPPGEQCAAGEAMLGCALSAGDFAAFHDARSNWRIRETANSYELELTHAANPDQVAPGPLLVRAKLSIDRRSSRPTQETFWVSDDGDLRSYQFTEVSFTPKTDIGADSPLLRPESLPARPRKPAATLTRTVANVDVAHLHLQVLLSLHAIGADVGQPIAIERKAREVLVHGVVGSDEDAIRIRKALAPFANSPGFRQEIYSASEFIERERHQAQAQSIAAEEYELSAVHIPVESMLRSHFASIGLTGTKIDAQIQTYTQTVLAQSAVVLQRAYTLQQFSRGFSEDELRSLAPADQRAWFALLNQHAAGLNESLTNLHRSLEWMVTLNGARAATSPIEGSAPHTGSVQATVERLLVDAQNLDQLVRSAFVATSAKNDEQAADPQKIQRSLASAQTEVLGIQKISQDYSAILRVP